MNSLLVVLPLLFLIPLLGSAQDRGITGKPAPSWDVASWHQLPEGKKALDVADFKGKILTLYFFQSWCPGCHRTGFPRLKELTKKYGENKDHAFVVIQTTFEGHRINTAAKLKPTAEKYGLKIPFGQSTGKEGTPEIMKKYRTGGTPWVVVIDQKGVVRFDGFHLPVAQAEELYKKLKAE